MAIKNMADQRFGKLVAKTIAFSKNGLYWNCVCDCGVRFVARGTSIRYGSTQSCGCGSLDQARRNMASYHMRYDTGLGPTARILKDLYRNMLDRCNNPANKRYYCYGGRGVSVCSLWSSSSGRRLFYEWCMCNGWRKGLELDRRDVNGNYEPSNCRFVDDFTQANNKTDNHYVTWNGETLTITEWARKIGVRPQALIHRFTRHWDTERAMTQPFRGRRLV